jgi:hypothetical protein
MTVRGGISGKYRRFHDLDLSGIAENVQINFISVYEVGNNTADIVTRDIIDTAKETFHRHLSAPYSNRFKSFVTRAMLGENLVTMSFNNFIFN